MGKRHCKEREDPWPRQFGIDEALVDDDEQRKGEKPEEAQRGNGDAQLLFAKTRPPRVVAESRTRHAPDLSAVRVSDTTPSGEDHAKQCISSVTTAIRHALAAKKAVWR